MANIKASQKDARRSAARAVRNRSIKSAVKTRVTKARRTLTASGDQEAPAQVVAAVGGLDRAVAKGVLHRNNAARRKSRLMLRLAALSGVAEEASAPSAKAAPKKSAAKRPAAAKAAPKKAPATSRSRAAKGKPSK
ncbi:MAG: 30S ribosomal protein S20 [Candidatus Dormibacterales bacterium]